MVENSFQAVRVCLPRAPPLISKPTLSNQIASTKPSKWFVLDTGSWWKGPRVSCCHFSSSMIFSWNHQLKNLFANLNLQYPLLVICEWRWLQPRGYPHGSHWETWASSPRRRFLSSWTPSKSDYWHVLKIRSSAEKNNSGVTWSLACLEAVGRN